MCRTLVLFISVTQLKFDDPRWLYNAWTYSVAVPVVALLLALVSHSLVSRYVHRSIQLVTGEDESNHCFSIRAFSSRPSLR